MASQNASSLVGRVIFENPRARASQAGALLASARPGRRLQPAHCCPAAKVSCLAAPDFAGPSPPFRPFGAPASSRASSDEGHRLARPNGRARTRGEANTRAKEGASSGQASTRQPGACDVLVAPVENEGDASQALACDTLQPP